MYWLQSAFYQKKGFFVRHRKHLSTVRLSNTPQTNKKSLPVKLRAKIARVLNRGATDRSAFDVCYALNGGAKADIADGLSRANNGHPSDALAVA
jgi:hypothetical protein